jgi:hypothetical protein
VSQLCRHIEAIFCDDIREEVGGKFSFMGVYSGDMIVANLPAVLPKLCIAITVVTPVDDPFDSLQLGIYLDGIELPIISTGQIDTPPETLGKDDGSVWIMVHMMFALSPFQIDKETTLRVIADTERGELRGRSLRIVTPKVPQTVTH